MLLAGGVLPQVELCVPRESNVLAGSTTHWVSPTAVQISVPILTSGLRTSVAFAVKPLPTAHESRIYPSYAYHIYGVVGNRIDKGQGIISVKKSNTTSNVCFT